jgi:hypothetical protein
MGEIRHRLSLVQTIVDGAITTGYETFDAELVFLQLRKSLELIAFSSLVANKDKYSVVHANFEHHWRAKQMLKAVEQLNPDFYPVPLSEPELLSNGVKHIEPIPDGFLTKDEFAFLYDKCAEVLHAPNPFMTKDPVIRTKYSVTQWVSRIQGLLRFHLIHLVDDTKWIVQIPDEGSVSLWPAVPGEKP